MYCVVVYYNQNTNSYYYRKYHHLYDKRCEVGYKNAYGHEVILVIDLTSNEKISLKKRVIDRLIRFLKNIK